MEEIVHPGIVRKIEGNRIGVSIVSKSMCSECHAKGMCSLSEMKVKEIEVISNFPEEFYVGQMVDLHITRSLGMKAVWISYGIPLIILLTFLLSLLVICENELLAGAISIGAVAVYYFIIFFYRDRIAKDVTFTISAKQ